MPTSFKQHLESILLQDSRFVDEQGELQGNVIKDCVNKLDEKLIEMLLNDKRTRDKFFLKVKEVYVFKASDFKFYLEQNSIDNSFTQYANRIGLTLNGKYLKDNTDVVLDFPYKDCILEGGQSTEEGLDVYFEFDENKKDYVEKQSKRKEIFYNTILAKDEIDRLLEPKAFVNVKKYDKNGESIPAKFNRNKEINKKRNLPEDTITDNLLIKGNNLLALHSLKSEFKNKIKLIYIDPPFNTGNDSFSYNDNFNHSSWLTFMYNRIEIARELLKDNGIMFLHIDQIEEAYLKIIGDEIFENENFVSSISVRSSTPSGTKTVHKTKTIIKQKDTVLVFRKSHSATFNPQYKRKDKWDTHFNYFLDRETGILHPLINILIKEKILKEGASIKDFDINNPVHRNFYIKNKYNICQTQSHTNEELKERSRKLVDKVLFINKGQENEVMFYNGRQLTPIANSMNIVFYNDERVEDFSILLCDFWDDIDFQNTQNEGGVSFPTAKKPEFLISRIIELATNQNDIVLDYHLGSGTTSAVAMKLNRQFIGVEQLDYGENDAVKRIINVINGDTSGISNKYNWEGGGSFIYLELTKNNQNAKELIHKCKDYKELVKLFDTLYSKYFLHYNVRINEFKNKICKEDNFKKLSLERQKEIFCRMLDNNQLYVHAGEMEDKQYGLSKDDIRLTKDFYQQ
ncbi:MAG: site-specific DNA-methyltransferase [Bacteroidaceae bacterium]|nr:site-specific DNA-methyltransferase [Bacteroidaceae bacterium]